MLLVYEPLLLYVTNVNEFSFSFGMMLSHVLRIFGLVWLAAMLAITAFYLLVRACSKKLLPYKIVLLLGFAAFFLLYIQGSWLNNDLPPLDGESIQWALYGRKQDMLLELIVIALAALLVWAVRRFGFGRVVRTFSRVTMVIVGMLAVSFVSTLVGNESLQDSTGEENENCIVRSTRFNTVSENKNFVVFVIDAVDARAFGDLVNATAEYQELFSDFTYFPDTMSLYPYTRDSITFLLTGQVNKNEKEYGRFSTDALNESMLFSALEERDYTIDLYEEDLIWRGERKFTIGNTIPLSEAETRLTAFARQELHYILFKYLPYVLKPYSRIESMDFKAIFLSNTFDLFDSGNLFTYDRVLHYPQLEMQPQNSFKFIHIEGGHVPFNMNANLESVEEGTYIQKVEASIMVLKAYLDRLKANGAYDDTAIIILGDHGYWYPYENPENGSGPGGGQLSRCNPVLLVKGFGEQHALTTSERAVSFLDLPQAYIQLLDGAPAGELFADAEPGRTRTVIWLLWQEEDHMVEYQSDGKAWECNLFEETGNVYDR